MTPSPEPKLIPAPHFRRTASSSECSLEAFTERLITAGAPEAFFDDYWDEKVSQVLVEECENYAVAPLFFLYFSYLLQDLLS